MEIQSPSGWRGWGCIQSCTDSLERPTALVVSSCSSLLLWSVTNKSRNSGSHTVSSYRIIHFLLFWNCTHHIIYLLFILISHTKYCMFGTSVVTYLNGFLDIILDVVNFLLLLSKTYKGRNYNPDWRFCWAAVTKRSYNKDGKCELSVRSKIFCGQYDFVVMYSQGRSEPHDAL